MRIQLTKKMSKICIEELRTLLSVDYDDVKQQKINHKKEQLYYKMKSLLEKYFDVLDQNSIAYHMKSAEMSEFYVKLDRNDFLGWSAFVPYKADDNGYNFNARPLQCCKRFLIHAKENNYLSNIHFEIQNFNVKFTMQSHYEKP